MLNLTLLQWLIPAITWLLVHSQPAYASPVHTDPEPANSKLVRIYSTRDGDVTRFWVENNELCEITVTFAVHTRNLDSTVPLPHTATFPAQSTKEAFVLQPADSSKRWSFSYTNYYKLGSYLAQHDDTHVYQLPYPAGRRYVVTQAYNGTYSHKGSNKYAVDWKMPEGTPVCAVRDGTVIKMRKDSGTGGASMKYDKFNNFVLIRHEDGTLAHYCHLQQNGVRVSLGQKVLAGQVIGRSGNTGFSSGPHLHLCIFRTIDGRERESIPVKFRTAEYGAVTLLEDGRYRAVQVGGALVEAHNRNEGSSGEGRGTAN